MAVMAREAWTDERLDDLKENVNRRFDDVDKRLDQVDKRLDAMQADMKHGFESIYRTMVIGFVTLFASVLGAALLGQP